VKLSELDPRWWSVDMSRRGQGIHFLCPTCRIERIGVAFNNPIDGGAPAPGCKFYWTRAGESFDDLTLDPSINAAAVGHWHGFIKSGETIGNEHACILSVQSGEVIDITGKVSR